MQISIRLGAISALAFAAVCLGLAIDGFTSAPQSDEQQLSGGASYAWFWSFLALVGFAIAWLSWKVSKAPQ